MDPVGKQSKISSNDQAVTHQKLIDGGGYKATGGFNKKSNTRDTSFSTSWQGKTKGATKHTFKG